MENLKYVTVAANRAAVDDADRDINGWIAEMRQEKIECTYEYSTTLEGVKHLHLKLAYNDFTIEVKARSMARICMFESTDVFVGGTHYIGRTVGREINVFNTHGDKLPTTDPVYDVVRVLHTRIRQEL